jgi:hypothetical protein
LPEWEQVSSDIPLWNCGHSFSRYDSSAKTRRWKEEANYDFS